MAIKLFLLVAVLTVAATQAANPRFRAVSAKAGPGRRYYFEKAVLHGMHDVRWSIESEARRVKNDQKKTQITMATSQFWLGPRAAPVAKDGAVSFKCATDGLACVKNVQSTKDGGAACGAMATVHCRLLTLSNRNAIF